MWRTLRAYDPQLVKRSSERLLSQNNSATGYSTLVCIVNFLAAGRARQCEFSMQRLWIFPVAKVLGGMVVAGQCRAVWGHIRGW